MKFEISQFKSLKYITRFPDDYKKEEKYPLIIFCMVQEAEEMI